MDELLAVLEVLYTDRAEASARGQRAARFMQTLTWGRQIDLLVDVVAGVSPQ